MIEIVNNQVGLELITNRVGVDLVKSTSIVDLVTTRNTIEIVGRSGVIDFSKGFISVPELYDSDTAPVSPLSLPYLRFERDLDGDVQAIYLGTVD